MPDGMINLLDVVKANSPDIIYPIVDEIGQIVPEITGRSANPMITDTPQIASGRTMEGTLYEILVRTALPDVSFRDANQGTAVTKSQHELRQFRCHTMTPRWSVDSVVVDKSKEGLGVLMAREARAHMMSALIHCCKQFYYGTTNDAKGFPGLLSQYDSDNMTHDAEGTGDATSSVWGVKFGPEFVQWIFGNNGRFNVPEIRVVDQADEDGNEYTAFLQELVAHIGLQMGNKYGVGRIKNIHASDSGKTLDDDMLAELLSLPPEGYEFDVLFMNKRSLKQLRASRTATNTSGAPAPFPTEAHGVPIIVTGHITSTETAA